MQITHDPQANIAYIRFRARQGTVQTVRLTEDFLVDIDETGSVCGVELLNANEQLVQGDGGKLIFLNQLDGTQGEMRVA